MCVMAGYCVVEIDSSESMMLESDLSRQKVRGVCTRDVRPDCLKLAAVQSATPDPKSESPDCVNDRTITGQPEQGGRGVSSATLSGVRSPHRAHEKKVDVNSVGYSMNRGSGLERRNAGTRALASG